MDLYLACRSICLLGQFPSMYKESPELFYPRLDEILAKMKGAEYYIQSSTVTLFWEIAKAEPEVGGLYVITNE